MLGLECSTVYSRDVDVDADRRRKLEAFEMWIWKRMEKMGWLDKVTYAEVLRRVIQNKSHDNYICSITLPRTNA